MRIVSWNCNCKFRDKYLPLITAYNPDILVIPECEDPRVSKDNTYKSFAEEYHYQWIGKCDFKGLGVFSKEKLAPLDWPNGGHQFFLPVNIGGKYDLIASWPGEPYIEELYDYLRLNESRITKNTIIAGDLNTNPVFDKKRKEKTNQDMVQLLAEIGLYSAYHYQTHEAHGQETTPTFYLHRNLSKSYHIDYCFLAPNRLNRFEIGSTTEWMGKGNVTGSDYLPLIIDIQSTLFY